MEGFTLEGVGAIIAGIAAVIVPIVTYFVGSARNKTREIKKELKDQNAELWEHIDDLRSEQQKFMAEVYKFYARSEDVERLESKIDDVKSILIRLFGERTKNGSD